MNNSIRLLCIALLNTPSMRGAQTFPDVEAIFAQAQRDSQTTTLAQYLKLTYNIPHQPSYELSSSIAHTKFVHATLIVLKDHTYPTIRADNLTGIFPDPATTARLLACSLDGICLAWQAIQITPSGLSTSIPREEIVTNYQWSMSRAATIQKEGRNLYLLECLQKYLKAAIPQQRNLNAGS